MKLIPITYVSLSPRPLSLAYEADPNYIQLQFKPTTYYCNLILAFTNQTNKYYYDYHNILLIIIITN